MSRTSPAMQEKKIHRLAHPSWIAGMKMMLDRALSITYLLQVYVRGFSAGSYSGICLLHLSGIIAWDPARPRRTIELREHFGAGEHSYGHWIDLNVTHGRFPLWQLLRQYPEVAHPQRRDIAPLRLVSWVSCEVPARVQQVLHQL